MIEEKKIVENIAPEKVEKFGAEKLLEDPKFAKKYILPTETKILNIMRKYALYFYDIFYFHF